MVLARFIPVVRTVMNPLAGAIGIPLALFTIWQVAGGVLWTVGITLAGYALGSRISGIDRYLLPIIAVIVAVSLIPLLLEAWRRRRRERRRGPRHGRARGELMNAAHHLTYLQAVVIGLIQGLTELFPVSSLGHTVLIPSWLGGSWAALVRQEDSAESPYLAFIVGLHLATALVLIGYYWREWLRLARGLVTSVAQRRAETPEQRLAWLIVIATIPVGLAGLKFEHAFRVLFARPDAAAIFLMINGGILLLGERYRRRGRIPAPADGAGPADDHDPEAAPVAVAAAAAAAAAAGPRGRGPGAARGPPPRPGRPRPERAWSTWPPSSAWPGSARARPCGSAPRRSWPCSPASAGRA